MSKRDLRLYFDDILESIEAIEDYLTNINSFEDFARDRKTYSATIREYIVIGEAVGRLMEVLEDRHPDYDWRMIKWKIGDRYIMLHKPQPPPNPL